MFINLTETTVEREQILSSRLALLTTLILDKEPVQLLWCRKAFKNLGPAILDPVQVVLQLISRVPSTSHSCRGTKNSTGRREKQSAYVDRYFRT